MSSLLILSEIYIYPVKSLKGISLKSSELDKRGLKYDRRFMLVDEHNSFITQRKYPKLATISTEIVKDHLLLKTPSHSDLLIPLEPTSDEKFEVKIWRSDCDVIEASKIASEWFTEFLKVPCRLVYMPDTTNRAVNPEYDSLKNSVVSFADGYPFLIVSEKSLKDLNTKLTDPISMDRFRPNLVISGGTAYQEDNWKSFSICDNIFYVCKPCERCVITTIDQSTGVITGKEPLETLTQYRKIDGKVVFGQNLICMGLNKIEIDEKINVLREK